MQPATRRILRGLAWVVFLIGGPLLLASARGYRLDTVLHPQSNLPRPDVGALVIRTTPRSATVQVDGVTIDARTPTGVGGLIAGPHTVRVERAGYHPIEKRIEIAGGRVTDLLHLLLIPSTVREERVMDGVDTVSVSPDEQWTVIARAGMLKLFRTEDLLRPPERSPRLQTRIAASPQHLRVLWSPRSDAVVIGVREEHTPEDRPEARLVLFPTERQVRQLPRGRTIVGWFPDGRTLALLNVSGVLSRVRVDDPRERTLASDVSLSAVHPRGIVVLQQASGAGTTPEAALLNAAGSRELFDISLPTLPHVFTLSGRGDWATIDSEGRLAVWTSQEEAWRPIAAAVKTVQWSPDGDKLLFQTSEFDLSAVNISEERSVLPPWFPVVMARLSVPLKGVQWYSDSQHVLFFSRDVLSLASIDPRGGFTQNTLASLDRGDAQVALTDRGAALLVTARRPNAKKPDLLEPVLLRFPLRTDADAP